MSKDKSDKPDKRKLGRPTLYSEEIVDNICNLLTGGMSLRKICMQDNFPDAATIYRWLDAHPDFCDKYTRAREAATENMLEEIFEIADSEDIKPEDKRVRIDTRKWAMGKLKPKKYGDRQIVDVGNKDGEALKVEGTDPVSITLRLAEALRMQDKPE